MTRILPGWLGLVGCLISAAPAGAAAFPDLEPTLRDIRAEVLATRRAPNRRVPESEPPPAPRVRRVADPADFSRLLDRARRRPTGAQEVAVGDEVYKVFFVRTAAAFPGERCGAGDIVVNTLFVSQPEGGAVGTAVYPFRLSAMCEGPATHESFMADADANGVIQDLALYDPTRGRMLHADKDPLTAAQSVEVDAYLAGLVRLFLSLP